MLIYIFMLPTKNTKNSVKRRMRREKKQKADEKRITFLL